jgi:hypothetical protein
MYLNFKDSYHGLKMKSTFFALPSREGERGMALEMIILE